MARMIGVFLLVRELVVEWLPVERLDDLCDRVDLLREICMPLSLEEGVSGM